MYFIVYENRPKDLPAGYVPLLSNVITYEHPLVWIDQISKNYRKYYVTYIHFWKKVDDSYALRCQGVHRDPSPAEGYEPSGVREDAVREMWQ